MARDRLAALRAERGGNSISEPPHELYSIGPSSINGLPDSDEKPVSNDLEEITLISDKIQEYRGLVDRISELHGHSLGLTDDAALQNDTAKLEDLQQKTSSLSSEIKRRIQNLNSKVKSGPTRNPAMVQHIKRVQEKFKDAIQDFQRSEQEFRTRYRQRVERQFKIVKPSATPEEVRAVVDDPDAGGHIFSNAVATSDRYGESRAAYKEVQDRHEDIKRIEKTITELAQLFNDMAVLISEDDEKIDTIENQAIRADGELEAGLGHTEKAVDHARAARKKRIICFFIILLILAIVAIIVAVAVTQTTKK